jgi:hypothetical protein
LFSPPWAGNFVRDFFLFFSFLFGELKLLSFFVCFLLHQQVNSGRMGRELPGVLAIINSSVSAEACLAAVAP